MEVQSGWMKGRPWGMWEKKTKVGDIAETGGLTSLRGTTFPKDCEWDILQATGNLERRLLNHFLIGVRKPLCSGEWT